MKTTKLFLALFITAASMYFIGCDESEDSLIEENGLSRDINDFMPQEILDILESLEMPINTGGDPPSIEGSFEKSPNILMNSNRSADNIGSTYADLTVTYSDQNSNKLTVTVKQKQNNTEGDGIGSFIVGNNNNFSVFSRIHSYNDYYNDSSLIAKIYTGTISAEGIVNYHDCIVMLDDYGDPNDHYISIGDTRVFYDSDNIAERVLETKSLPVKKGENQNMLNDEYSDNK